MKKNKIQSLPFCSIIVLNYFGEKVIETTLNSLLNINYTKNKYEIIIVDNNSKDKSREILNKYAGEHKNIKLFFLNRNLGFSKGNNVGIKHARGEFVALLNNDCVVEKNWLKELVKTASKDDKIFAVNSKILLYPKHINVKFHINAKLTPVFAWLSKSYLYDDLDSRVFYLPLWRKDEYFKIEVPYEPYLDQNIEFVILFNSRGNKISENIDLHKIISFDNKALKISKTTINGDEIEYKISAKLSDRDIIKNSLDKIQNAGIIVFQDGYGRDIGAVVRNNQQFYEYDLNQYDKEREIYAACGAAVLYNKNILDKIGYLDESFFMYYEDVEISERARIAGFKSFYSPKAVVRHYHALFSKEWSPFFIYHVEKGRLLHILYNFPLKVFFAEYFNLFYSSFIILLSILFKLRFFLYRFRTKKTEGEEPNFVRRIQIIKALIYFVLNCPFLLIRRLKYDQSRNEEALTQNYLKILKGDWYF